MVIKCYGYGEETLSKKVINLLCNRNETLAVAESCTGGKLGGRLTSISGASSIFLGGVIAYSNFTKQTLLNVNNELLDAYGAVSNQVAQAMAKGVK